MAAIKREWGIRRIDADPNADPIMHVLAVDEVAALECYKIAGGGHTDQPIETKDGRPVVQVTNDGGYVEAVRV